MGVNYGGCTAEAITSWHYLCSLICTVWKYFLLTYLLLLKQCVSVHQKMSFQNKKNVFLNWWGRGPTLHLQVRFCIKNFLHSRTSSPTYPINPYLDAVTRCLWYLLHYRLTSMLIFTWIAAVWTCRPPARLIVWPRRSTTDVATIRIVTWHTWAIKSRLQPFDASGRLWTARRQ